MKSKKDPIVLELSPNPNLLDWNSIFRREAPVEIEVGCGKGRFLLHQAIEKPETDFLGIEYANAYFQTIAHRATAKGLTNIRVARAEAGELFRDRLPPQCVSGFHLLYPDPWPKKRHNKRRLIQHSFLADLRRTLAPEASINIATDHADYYEWMVDHFERWKGTFILEYQVYSTRKELSKLEGRTNYELKFIEEGRPLHHITGYRSGF